MPPGEEASALADLPVAALRLAPDIRNLLRRLGFKTVGALIDKPRAPFAARFAEQLLRRLDQALGLLDEPLTPIVAPPVYHSLHYLLEPIVAQDAVIARASRMMQALANVLTRDDAGARALRLCLYRVDGAVETVDIGLTLPTRNVAHVVRLLDLKLATLAATHDTGFNSEFGYEAIGLAITRAEPMPARQIEISPLPLPSLPRSGAGSGWGTATPRNVMQALIDTLRQRVGAHRVRRFEPVSSHIPERAEVLAPIDGEESGCERAWPLADEKARPLLLLPQAEPTEVTALDPRRTAAAFLLARHDLLHRRQPRPRTHRRAMVAPPPPFPLPRSGGGLGGGADARLLPGRGFRRSPFLALPRRPLRARDGECAVVRARLVCVS